MRALIAVVLAAVASTLYALSTSLQALEARSVPAHSALKASLLGRLMRRRRWLAGTAAGAIAWPVQAVALSLASVALVQPALGLGLIVLLLLGAHVLHEHVGAREAGAAAAIVAAVAVLGWAAPSSTGAFTAVGTWTAGVALGLVALAPYALRAAGTATGLGTSICAGLGWGAVGLGTVLVDEGVANRHWLAALAWGLGVAAASWSSLLAEMTSLQFWPATRAIPVAFALEMAAPAAIAPALTHSRPAHAVAFGLALGLAAAAAVVLGSSRAVARAAGR